MNAMRWLLATILLAVAAAPRGAVAQQQTMRFEPLGVFELEIEGKTIPKARLFNSKEAGALLVMAPELPFPIAVVPRNKTIQQLDPAELKEEALGSFAWTPAGKPTAVATFDLVDGKPVFQLDGKKMRLVDKPALLGPTTREGIVAYDPSFAYRTASADPPTLYLDVINDWSQNVLVKIYFSSQCPECRELLPGIFKTMDRITNPKVKFEFHGMPLPATKDPLAVELKISGFPTGIVFVDGKEVGRAFGPSWRMPAMAIHNALRGISINPDALRVPPGAQPGP
jgi:thiol-disulfide isomerase/thioredoxin